MVTRALLHQLVDQIPDEDLGRAAEALAAMRTGLADVLAAAPLDDEPMTDAQHACWTAVLARYHRDGGALSTDEVVRLVSRAD